MNSFCAIYHLEDGRSIVTHEASTAAVANALLEERLKRPDVTGGHIEEFIEGIGWAMLTDFADDDHIIGTEPEQEN